MYKAKQDQKKIGNKKMKRQEKKGKCDRDCSVAPELISLDARGDVEAEAGKLTRR